MTTPEDDDEAMEKETPIILDEAEAIINDPSESVERKKEAQSLIQRAIEKSSSETEGRGTSETLSVHFEDILHATDTRTRGY